MFETLKHQPHKIVKHTQTLPTNCLSVFAHFVGLALKGLNCISCQSKILLWMYSTQQFYKKDLMLSGYSTRLLCKKLELKVYYFLPLFFIVIINCNVTSTRFIINRFVVNW